MTEDPKAEFKPNYKRKCTSCDQKPTVDIFEDGTLVLDSALCGPCFFGTAAALDSDTWNED